jgi:hypothetical protein
VFVVANISARDGERAEIPLSIASRNQQSDKQNLSQEFLLELSAIASELVDLLFGYCGGYFGPLFACMLRVFRYEAKSNI